MTAERARTLLRLEEEFGVLIRRIRRVIAERAEAVHPELQSASYLLLAYIAEHGPVRASLIAEKFQIDKGAVSRQLQHLMELGLVDKVVDPADGRAHLISASEEARRRLDEVVTQRRRWLDERLKDWSADELEAFTSELARYNATLES
ncbi:MarR family transcriptional regulator [Nocardioides fonticola]|uniref:MarR family transcriptional regulator n=1 Tax=Nocardioides fonticola TaxID=450363 RepID=A0ABP7XI60_9ACTN